MHKALQEKACDLVMPLVNAKKPAIRDGRKV
jgi:hypothetical protein